MATIVLTAAVAAFLPAYHHGVARRDAHATSRLAVTTSRLAVTASRARAPVAFLGDDSAWLREWTKSERGLYYKDTQLGVGPEPEDGQVLSVAFNATLLESRQPLYRAARERPFSFVLDRKAASDATGGGMDPVTELLDGMRVGGRRRALLPPSSSLAEEIGASDRGLAAKLETIEFEIELVQVKTGVEAALFKARPLVAQLFNFLLIASFVPDILNLLGVPRPGSIEDVAGTLASSPHAPAIVDSANRWAADGLAGLF